MLRRIFLNFISVFSGIILFALVFCVYFLTCAKYVQPGDSTEMVTAAATLGVTHQPGYPLNSAIGHLFYKADFLGLLPVQRINLTSSFLQAATVFFLFFLMFEVFGILFKKDASKEGTSNKRHFIIKLTASFSTSLFLAFSLIFWQYATKFEVFPLNNLFAVVLLLIAVKLRNRYQSEDFKIGELLLIVLSALVFGLAITHHQTIVLIVPSLVIIMWEQIRKLVMQKHLLSKIFFGFTLVIFFIAGASLYFLLLIKFSNSNLEMPGGAIKNFPSAMSTLMRSEYGAFSPYLKTESVTRTNYPMDQIAYYLRSIYTNFSIYGVIFLVLGIFYLIKKSKLILTVMLIGVGISGFLFLAYANFPLNDSFNLATVNRFQMLPNIFISILIGIGIYALLTMLSQVVGKSNFGYMSVVLMIMIAVSALPIYFNFKKADLSKDRFTQDFIDNSYAKVPDGSLVMVSGDVYNMTGEFYRLVQAPNTKTKIFTPGRFYLNWYLTNLMRQNTDISVPPPENGKMFTTTTQVVDVNYDKYTIYISPELLTKDPQIQQSYTLYPKHLLYEVKKKGEDIKLEDWQSENKAIYDSLDAKAISDIHSRGATFEEQIVYYYARYFYFSGYVFSQVKLYDDAITNYQRSLALEPNLADNYKGMAEAFAQKQDPDYASALQYMMRYQQLIYAYDQQEAYNVQSEIEEYKKKYNDLYQAENQKKEQTATESGEMSTASPSAK